MHCFTVFSFTADGNTQALKIIFIWCIEPTWNKMDLVVLWFIDSNKKKQLIKCMEIHISHQSLLNTGLKLFQSDKHCGKI